MSKTLNRLKGALLASFILIAPSVVAQTAGSADDSIQGIVLKKDEKKGTYGFWNGRTNVWQVKPNFTQAYPFVSITVNNEKVEVAFVQKGSKWQAITENGKKIEEFNDVRPYSVNSAAIAVQTKKGKWGYFGLNGNPNTDFTYADAEPTDSNGIGMVKTARGNGGLIWFIKGKAYDFSYAHTKKGVDLYKDSVNHQWIAVKNGEPIWQSVFLDFISLIEQEGLTLALVKSTEDPYEDRREVINFETGASLTYPLCKLSNVKIAPMKLINGFENPDFLTLTCDYKSWPNSDKQYIYFLDKKGNKVLESGMEVGMFGLNKSKFPLKGVMEIDDNVYNTEFKPLLPKGATTNGGISYDEKYLILNDVWGLRPGNETVAGVIDGEGNIIVPFEYHRIEPNKQYSPTGYYLVDKKGNKTLVDMDFKTLGSESKDFSILSPTVAVLRKGNKWAYADPQTKEPFSQWFDDPKMDPVVAAALRGTPNILPHYPVASGLCIVQVGNKRGVYNVDKKKLVVPIAYDDFGRVKYGMIPVRLNGKYGYLNTDGKLVVPIQYLAADMYEDKYPYGVCGIALIQPKTTSGLYAVFDRNGKLLQKITLIGRPQGGF